MMAGRRNAYGFLMGRRASFPTLLPGGSNTLFKRTGNGRRTGMDSYTNETLESQCGDWLYEQWLQSHAE